MKTIYEQINNNGMYYFILLICVIGMWFGTIMNFLVIQHNEGRMPVLANFEYKSETHFTYQNTSEVDYYYFSDMFKIKDFYFSLGDFLMIFFLLIMIGAICYQLYKRTYILKKNIMEKYNYENSY